MIFKYLIKFCWIALLFTGASSASHAAAPDPLFQDDSIIDVRLAAPFTQMMKDRPEEEEVAGTFAYQAADGSTVNLDVKIRTRGNYRHRKDICPFAPLRINFKKSQLDDSVFDKQDKLKLVTHCDNLSRKYPGVVLKEYLAYRLLNAVTDVSYKVRLLRITYVYTDDDNDERVDYAFFIEDKDRMGKRVDMQVQEINSISLTALQREYTNLSSIYQLLIGNLDFSPVKGSDGQECCHNHTLLSADKITYWSVPFDFDLSGFVDAPHAIPNPAFGQLTVRQRIYRGRCINSDLLPETFQKFRDKRVEIETLIDNQTELDSGARRSINAYIKSFYKLIDNEERALKNLAKACI